MKPVIHLARLVFALSVLVALGCNGTLATPIDATDIVGTWQETDLAPPPATGWYVFEHQLRFGADGSYEEWIAQSNATPNAIPPTAFSNEFTGTYSVEGGNLVTIDQRVTQTRLMMFDGTELVIDGMVFGAVSK